MRVLPVCIIQYASVFDTWGVSSCMRWVDFVGRSNDFSSTETMKIIIMTFAPNIWKSWCNWFSSKRAKPTALEMMKKKQNWPYRKCVAFIFLRFVRYLKSWTEILGRKMWLVVCRTIHDYDVADKTRETSTNTTNCGLFFNYFFFAAVPLSSTTSSFWSFACMLLFNFYFFLQ